MRRHVLNQGTVAAALAATLLGAGQALAALSGLHPPRVALAQAADESWANRAPLPAPNSETAVAEVDGRIYVIGGYPSTRAVQPTVQVYFAAEDRWEVTTPLPSPLHHTMAAGVNGKLYVIGGEIAGPNGLAGVGGPATYVNSTLEYDPATATWTPRAPMPTARSSGATAVIDGRIYVAGGRPPRGADFAVYDPATDTWEVLPDLPTQRNHLAAAAIGGKVYVVGGRFGAGVGSEMTGALEVYDPATRTWAARAPMLAPRGGVNGIAAQGCLYVFGGEGNDPHPLGIFPEIDLYDPLTDTWHALGHLPVPVHGVTGSAVLDGWIHLPGGGTARGGNSGSTIHQVYRVTAACGA
jgi:N-acetylneuraminic acid mutarotase